MPMVQSWILVLTVFYQTPAITTPPGLYATKGECTAAAQAFEAGNLHTDLLGVTLEAHCIPGPTLILNAPGKK